MRLAIAFFVLAFSLTAIVERFRAPMPALDDRDAKRGGEIYANMCAVCHGNAGQGYKADEAPRLAQPDFLATVTDDYLEAAIAHGRTGTTMSAWSRERGGPLNQADLGALIAFIRTWDKKPRVVLDERPPRGDFARGALTFLHECEKCHGARGAGGPNVHIGGQELLESASTGFLRHAIQMGRPGTIMPAFGDKLGESGVEDLLSLLATWKAQGPIVPRPAVSARPPTPPLPLGPVPLNPNGPAPIGFERFPKTTHADVVKAQLDRHARMVLMDARAPSDYVREHITGAVSVPFYDPSPYFDALPKNAWLVAYCSCPHAESTTLAQKLADKGFRQVTVLDEGLLVWKRKNYGTTVGEKP